MDLFKGYKENRQGLYGQSKGQVNVSPYFKYTYNEIIPEQIHKHSCKTLQYNN